MSQYLPEVAWSTYARNVLLGNTPYRYKLTVNYLDPNEPGANTMEMQVGDWFIDNAGYPFLIEEINGAQLTVYDVNERGDGVTSAYGPYPDKIGYVYRPKNGAFMLTQAQLRKLDPSASDIIIPIEKGIVWKYRGLNIIGDTFDLQNVTKLVLENIQIEELPEDGWQGGKTVKLTAQGSGISGLEVYLEGHGFNEDLVYYSGTWNKALAVNTIPESAATHLAVRVDDNNFIAYSFGEIEVNITDDLNNPLVDGEYYFLSQTTAGKVTRTCPSEGLIQYVGQYINGKFKVDIHEPYEYLSENGVPFDILSSDNVFTGINEFSNTFKLSGISEQFTTKILYFDPTTKLISYGDAPSGSGGIPGGDNSEFQYNDNGTFGGTPLFRYDKTTGNISFGYYPVDPYIPITIGGNYNWDYNYHPLLQMFMYYDTYIKIWANKIEMPGYLSLHNNEMIGIPYIEAKNQTYPLRLNSIFTRNPLISYSRHPSHYTSFYESFFDGLIVNKNRPITSFGILTDDRSLNRLTSILYDYVTVDNTSEEEDEEPEEDEETVTRTLKDFKTDDTGKIIMSISGGSGLYIDLWTVSLNGVLTIELYNITTSEQRGINTYNVVMKINPSNGIKLIDFIPVVEQFTGCTVEATMFTNSYSTYYTVQFTINGLKSAYTYIVQAYLTIDQIIRSFIHAGCL